MENHFKELIVVSPNHEDHLEFLSIKVPNGPLTSKLQHIKLGDEIIVNSKGTLALLHVIIFYLGRNLYRTPCEIGLTYMMYWTSRPLKN